MTQTDAIVAIVREVLGADVIGAYLHGSAVLGGLRRDSDTDVLVVSRRHTNAEERRTLVERLMPISGSRARPPARPVEVTIVAQSEVRPWRYPPRSEFLYGEWHDHEYEAGLMPSPGPSPDLAPLITMVLSGSHPLFGPPPAEVLDPVPHEDLLRAIVAGIPGLLADLEPDTRNVLLTLARIWTTLATGEIRSKDGAADWALAHLPEEHRSVLARARRLPWRGGGRRLGRPHAARSGPCPPRGPGDRAYDRPMTDETAWGEALARTTDEGRAAAEAARALIRRLDPDVVEVVWPHQGTIGYGVGPKKMSEHYAYLAVHPKHVNLGFYRGASLPDPAGLLGGPGKGMRHLKIGGREDLERPEISELLCAAKAEREAALGR